MIGGIAMPKIVSKEQVSDREVKMDTGVADHLLSLIHI